MDFNRIYEAGEEPTTTVNPTDSNVTDTAIAEQNSTEAYEKAQDEVYIVLNQLKLKIKEFKNNEQIKAMIDRYDGLTKENQLDQSESTKESVEDIKESTGKSTKMFDAQRLTEAKKGTMKYYYKNICNTIDWYIKYIIIGAIVITVVAIAAGVSMNNAYKSALRAAGIGKADGPGLLKWIMHKDDAQADITATGNAKVVSNIMNDPSIDDATKKAKLQAIADKNPVAAESIASLDKKIDSTPITSAESTTEPNVGSSNITDSNTEKTPEPIIKETDLNTWQGRVKAGKASDADMEEAYNAYLAGTYTPGSKTMEYFKQTHPEHFATPVSSPASPSASNSIPTPTSDASIDKASSVNGEGNNTTGGLNPEAPTNTPKPWESDAGFQRWKAQNPKNYNSMAAQAKATGRDPDEAAYTMYQQALTSPDVNAFRSAGNAQGMTDASGSGRTDRHAMRTMNKANLQAYNAQQVDNMVKADPNLAQYIEFYKKKYPKMANASNEDIIKLGSRTSGLMKTVQDRNGRPEQVLPPENKPMYDALMKAKQLLKNKTVPTA